MKKLFTSLILFLCLINIGFVSKVYSQTPGQIGTGTGTSTNLPIYTYYGYNYSQQIYTAAEVSAAIGTATYITAIKFYSTTVVPTQTNYNNWVVYMGNTTQNNFASNTSWIPVSSLTQVFSGTLPTMTSGNWVTIQLATPFVWNGTDNLVIAVNEKSPSYSDYPGTAWGSYSAGANRGILYYEDTANPDPASPPTAKGRYADIPRLQIESTTLQPCSTAPPANIAVNNVTATSANVTWTTSIGATYVVQYRPVSGGPWQTINVTTPLAGSQLLTNLTEQTQYEVQVATICGGTTGAFSPSVNFTTPAISYCTAASTSSTIDGYIGQVTVTGLGAPSMVSNSGFSNYTDYSTDPTRLVTLVRGNTATVTVSKNWPDYQWSFGTGVWIDFNRNGVFEANERVLNSPSNTTTPLSATFTVPSVPNVYNGNLTTKMRVVLRESSAASECGNFTYGEVEDYAVKLIDLQGCNTNPPANIAVNNITPTTANVTWTSTTGATYIVRWRVSPSGAWQQVTVTTPLISNQIISGLTEQTPYEVQVATVCNGTTGAFSPSVNFTTPAITYCTATSTSSTIDGYISQVAVTPTNSTVMISNSGFSNYTDYSTDATRLITLVRGSANNSISISKTWPGTQYSFTTGVWIDFNRNGVFEASERIVTSPSNTTTPITATFSVPGAPGVYPGTLNTRMRVALAESSSVSACGNFTWGEVEDYSVKLIDQPACTTAPPTNITVTNLTATSATVSWIGAVGATYTIRWRVSPSGAWQTYTLPVGQSIYTIPGLTEQTTYDLQISTKCGTTTGAYSPTTTFTTPPLSYCQMTGTGTNDHISNVTVTSSNPGVPVMSNNSAQTNYTSYTTPETLITLDAGSVNNKISVTKAWVNSTYNGAVTAWIDFDRNGQFTDAERILISSASTTTPVTAVFPVPANAYTGPLTTTMRVVMKRTSAPVMCQNAVNGEVEDYRVRIRPCSLTTPNQPTMTPTHNSVTLAFSGSTLTYLVRYRAQTTPPGAWTEIYASALLNNIPLVINGLTPATTYEVQVASVCGDVVGTFTPIKTFTTKCDPTPPNVTISNITTSTALITWSPLAASSTYIMRWRKVGSTGAGSWTTVNLPAPPANTYVLGSVVPLEPYTTYEVQVANQCIGENTPNPYSNPKVFTTERTCELPPPGLTITQLFPTMAEVKWDPFPGATYVLRYRKVGIPSWTEVPSITNTLVLNGLTELTKYEMQVVNICNGTPGAYTPPYYFTTPTVVYCNMGSTNSAAEHIAKVTVKPNGKPVMENASGASTYTDYTGVPKTFIELIQGSTDNEIIIEKKWTGTNYNEGIAVWIDFNRNGEFDINERVFTSPPNTTSPVSGKFDVPADAFVSMTDYKYVVMRVAMQRDGIPVSCVNFANGEVEDYTVRISKKAVSNPVNQTDILIYPNPVTTVLYVKNISSKAKYKIYNAAGQVVSQGILLNNQINVSRLINGVYVIDIEDNDRTAQKKFIKE
ncbi:GEVED domain-containing protein [Chryseobacterium gallinarum]|uniref:GEVED domain-containing protein n=1 Tax=Chryseobacterium gallinarum TaxID=1324352 RepID=UPI002024ADC5|nr:GEVED domain-containing protein [Chryseobacterium gallinarum]MCL8535677.1 GEVED domain-containing protein [Chryseobacterium gallinarum]